MIDFENARSIVIPEGEVAVIARGDEILWRKQKYKRELAYLESTGTQYFDTQIKAESTLTVEATVRATSQNGAYFIFGSRPSNNNDTYACLVNSSKRIGYRAGDGTFLYSSGYDATDGKHTYKIDNGVFYRDGVVVNSTCEGVSVANSNNIALLTVNTGNVLDKSQTFRGYLYSCKMWQNGEVLRDFIPVLDLNDRPCMYDRVTEQFFYNQGTGEFAYGELTRLPEEYQKVEYLESTGTQFVDTGYAFKDDFSWEIDFEGISLNKTIFGGRTSGARTAVLYQYGVTNVTTCPIGSSHGGLTPFQLGDLSSGRHTVKMSVASSKGSVWVDGAQKYDSTAFSGAYISGTTQAIFADNFGGGNVQEHTSGKVYGLKMWQGTTLVRDLVPCYRKSDGKPGMYDLVTNEFFTNAGTGEFLYGEKI